MCAQYTVPCLICRTAVGGYAAGWSMQVLHVAAVQNGIQPPQPHLRLASDRAGRLLALRILPKCRVVLECTYNTGFSRPANAAIWMGAGPGLRPLVPTTAADRRPPAVAPQQPTCSVYVPVSGTTASRNSGVSSSPLPRRQDAGMTCSRGRRRGPNSCGCGDRRCTCLCRRPAGALLGAVLAASQQGCGTGAGLELLPPSRCRCAAQLPQRAGPLPNPVASHLGKLHHHLAQACKLEQVETVSRWTTVQQRASQGDGWVQF